jgi:hypothetical protein
MDEVRFSRAICTKVLKGTFHDEKKNQDTDYNSVELNYGSGSIAKVKFSQEVETEKMFPVREFLDVKITGDLSVKSYPGKPAYLQVEAKECNVALSK